MVEAPHAPWACESPKLVFCSSSSPITLWPRAFVSKDFHMSPYLVQFLWIEGGRTGSRRYMSERPLAGWAYWPLNGAMDEQLHQDIEMSQLKLGYFTWDKFNRLVSTRTLRFKVHTVFSWSKLGWNPKLGEVSNEERLKPRWKTTRGAAWLCGSSFWRTKAT